MTVFKLYFVFTLAVTLTSGGLLKNAYNSLSGRSENEPTTHRLPLNPIINRGTQNYLKDTHESSQQSVTTEAVPATVDLQVGDNGGFTFLHGDKNCWLSPEPQSDYALFCNETKCTRHQQGVYKCKLFKCFIKFERRKAGCVMDERRLITAPNRSCPNGEKRTQNGDCRKEFS